jgi:glycosyltransferase involved in cell wall biosynthesis
METQQPLISIVMPSYNQGKYIEEAICSILDQGYPMVEIIIIDGGSTDSSVEIIKKYEKYLAYWISEQDTGQSNALNKGFRKARGDLLTWLNSDDVLMPGALNTVAKAYIANPKSEWFTGKCMWMDPEGRIIKCGCGLGWNSFLPRMGVLEAGGPSAFFTKNLLERTGYVNEDFHYMMDTELWWRFYDKCGATYKRVNNYLWGLRLHPAAKMSGHNFTENESANNPEHPKWKQISKERAYVQQQYNAHSENRRYGLGLLLSRTLKVLSLKYCKAVFDQVRYTGQNECGFLVEFSV